MELIFKDEVYAIIGAAMEVYNQLGPGFLEPVYQEAMEMEAADRKIPTRPQHEIVVRYKERALKKFYVADLFCFDKIIVELKALDHLTSREESQLINYLKGHRNARRSPHQLWRGKRIGMETHGSHNLKKSPVLSPIAYYSRRLADKSLLRSRRDGRATDERADQLREVLSRSQPPFSAFPSPYAVHADVPRRIPLRR